MSEFEPLACHLQEVRPRALSALTARMVGVIALKALATLGLSGASFHESFHADGGQRLMAVTECSDQNRPQQCRAMKAPWSDRTVEQPTFNSLYCAAESGCSWIMAPPAPPLAVPASAPRSVLRARAAHAGPHRASSPGPTCRPRCVTRPQSSRPIPALADGAHAVHGYPQTSQAQVSPLTGSAGSHSGPLC